MNKYMNLKTITLFTELIIQYSIKLNNKIAYNKNNY